jgi:tRNA pseudouridine38-40 synthase
LINNNFNLCVLFSYNGNSFYGSQFQLNKRTVQGEISSKLKEYFLNLNHLTFSSRTDKGVSAKEQYLGFKVTNNKKDICKKFHELKKSFDNDIFLSKISFMPNNFNARRDVEKRTYEYEINNKLLISKINLSKMIQSSYKLIGVHNFMSFAGKNAKDKFIREIYDISIDKINSSLIFTITGKSFIHQQVRRIIFALIRVGLSKESSSWIENILHAPQKGSCKGLVDSNNLTLKKVLYQKKHQKLLEKV